MVKKKEDQWWDYSWNPITGCSKLSDGCLNCYAAAMANRFKCFNNFEVTLNVNKLNLPLSKKIPCKFFVNSMGDLFHDNVTEDMISKVFEVIDNCPEHTFIILTKRPENIFKFVHVLSAFSMKNVWLGVTVENEKYYNRIDALKLLKNILNIPISFISCEPLLSPLNSIESYLDKIDWIICGAETGTKIRTMNDTWALDLWNVCINKNIPFWFKKVSKNIEHDEFILKELKNIKEFPKIINI